MVPYPIEVDFPDIGAYAEGNTGVPYVYSFDSGVPGSHTMINALTHGNEVCGAIAVKALLDGRVRPRRGRVTLAFANVEAYRRFDPAAPDASRFVDQDFNRVWHPATLDNLELDSSELRRARAMRPLIDEVDFLLDLHSMHERSAPLNVCGPLDKGIALARRLATPAWIVSDEGHPEGRRMRDYGAFGDPASARNALLVECGQHWEASAVAVAKNCCARFLVLCGNLDLSDVPEGWLKPLPERCLLVRVTEPVVADGVDFRFAADYTGLELFEEAGTVIGWNGVEPVYTPYPNCVLVMPSLRQLRAGVTVVRFGRLLD
ncbi:M14 family metallopeptidase [Pseudoduganella namucuonensis]|uniref:Succinylglutamate desuccinylase n=1 Tax=Pseudoduganella namucuonensis TaxID=1035707 RepID=A0A1I7K234_9BURK|nr:M14 family metallopeptidase [Pseudoduganella namucuonensis]SFU91477.1 Succinylglutamate desuccinylase [Pseudoduganella namucuonensis]